MRRQPTQGDQRRKRGRDNGRNDCEFAGAGGMRLIIVLATYVYQQVLPTIISLRHLRHRKFFCVRVVNHVRG